MLLEFFRFPSVDYRACSAKMLLECGMFTVLDIDLYIDININFLGISYVF